MKTLIDREELYMKLGRIEKFCHELKVCEEHKVIPQFVPNDEAYKVGGYAKEILSYIRSNNDFNLAIECCEIERSTLCRLSVEDKEIMSSIALCVYTLREIHDFAGFDSPEPQPLSEALNTERAEEYDLALATLIEEQCRVFDNLTWGE